MMTVSAAVTSIVNVPGEPPATQGKGNLSALPSVNVGVTKMKLIESKVVIEFSFEERDILINYILHDMTHSGMSEQTYEALKQRLTGEHISISLLV